MRRLPDWLVALALLLGAFAAVRALLAYVVFPLVRQWDPSLSMRVLWAALVLGGAVAGILRIMATSEEQRRRWERQQQDRSDSHHS